MADRSPRQQAARPSRVSDPRLERGSAAQSWSIAIGLVILVAIGAFGARGYLEERRLSSRARAFVERAGEQAVELAGLFERPLRDISGDRQLIRTQLHRIGVELRLAERPDALTEARFELGRLYAAIGDVHTALAFFDSARRSGSQDPRLGYARGLALAEIAERARASLHRLPQGPTRDHLARLAHQRLTLPALAEIEGARQRLGGQRPWADIHLAYLRADYDRVLEGIRQVGANADAERLEGRSLLARARESRGRQGEADRQAAARALKRALELAPSHPDTYLASCTLWLEQLETHDDGPEPPAANRPAIRARAEVACGDGLRLDPSSFLLRSTLASLHLHWARRGSDSDGFEHGSAPSPSREALEALISGLSEPATPSELGGEGLARMPDGPSGFAIRVSGIQWLQLRAESRRLHGDMLALADEPVGDAFDDARTYLGQAIEEVRRLGDLPADFVPFELDGIALDLSIARWQQSRGGVGDPVPWLELASSKLDVLENHHPGSPSSAESATGAVASHGGASSIESALDSLDRRLGALRRAPSTLRASGR